MSPLCVFYPDSATDDFNHGVVLSSRPLRSNEVFQVRIDKMVDKWAGSIEIGVTTHNPAYLQLPSTMTNLRSGNTTGLKYLNPKLRWPVSLTLAKHNSHRL